MNLVMDTVFLEHLSFSLPAVEACLYQSRFSLQETFEGLCAHIGIDLVDYHSGMVVPIQDRVVVNLYSKTWVEKAARRA